MQCSQDFFNTNSKNLALMRLCLGRFGILGVLNTKCFGSLQIGLEKVWDSGQEVLIIRATFIISVK